MRKIRILFYHPNFHWGGAAKIILPLINNLDNSKFEKTLITNFDTGEMKNYIANEIRFLCPLMDKNKRVLIQLPKTVYRLSKIINDYDAVVCGLEMSTDYIAILSRILSWKKPKIITFVMTDVFRFTKEYPKRCPELVLTRNVLKYADNVLFLCKLLENAIKKRLQIKKSNVLYPPIEIEMIRLSAQETVEMELFNERKVFIAYGRLILPKRFDIIVKAIKYLKDDNVRLLIIGDGPLKNELVSLTGDLNVKEKVEFLPYTSNPYKYLGRCFATVFASNYEGFGLAVIESFALGKPVISTPTYYGPMDVIKHGENGLIAKDFKPASLADEIKKLLSDDNLYRKLSENSLKNAVNFDISNVVKRFENIIFETLNEILR